MVLKRQGAIQTYMSAPAAKRLRAVERKVNYIRRRVDKKLAVYNFATTGALANGAITALPLLPANTRDVKFLYLRAAGALGSAGVDVYLVQSKYGATPAYGNFQPIIGGFLLDNDSRDNFYIWKKILNTQGGTTFTMRQRFSKGFITENQTTTTPVGKRLFLVVKNNSGAGVNINIAVEIWGHDMEE